MKSYKAEIREILFYSTTKAGRIFDRVLFFVIILSVLMAMLESVSGVRETFKAILRVIEWVITILFSIEYLLRIYAAPQRKKYVCSFYGVIDLLAVLPSYLGFMVIGSQYLIVIRAVRLLRIFRIFKLTLLLKESSMIAESLQRSLKKILVFTYFILIIVVILGTIMYVVEGNINPLFANIPKSVYWAIVTLTTVGYGDITPITFLGQLISTIVMLLGYAIIAVPTGIVSADIIKQHLYNRTPCPKCHNNRHLKEAEYCHHCGEKLIPPTYSKAKTV